MSMNWGWCYKLNNYETARKRNAITKHSGQDDLRNDACPEGSWEQSGSRNHESPRGGLAYMYELGADMAPAFEW